MEPTSPRKCAPTSERVGDVVTAPRCNRLEISSARIAIGTDEIFYCDHSSFAMDTEAWDTCMVIKGIYTILKRASKL